MNKSLKNLLRPFHQLYLRNYCLKNYAISEYVGHNTNYKHIVLLGHQRTGSTLLVNTLRQHPNNISYSEIFADKPLINHESLTGDLEKLNQYQRLYAIDFFEKYISRAYKDHIQTVFHKIFPPAFQQRPILLDYYKNRSDFKFIYLRRKDLLATYTSKLLAQSTGHWSSTKGSYSEKQVTIDPTDCMLTIDSIRAEYDYFDFHFKHRSPMKIWYEDLNEDFYNTMEHVLDYANLGKQPLTAKLKKQGNSNLSETITNYEEIIDFLHSNNCQWILD